MSAPPAAAEFRVELEGYEGPLDLLLELARAQKVDLRAISVSELADQYLAFVDQARKRDLVLAADYLVMAAWLAYLKSRLLLPGHERSPEEPEAEETARELAFRLAKLEAMRRAFADLEAGPVLGRRVFPRGAHDEAQFVASRRLEGDLYALAAAYADVRRRASERSWAPAPPRAYALDDARERLRRLLPELFRWTPLTGVAPKESPGGPTRASFLASTLSASLELVREGDLEARQREAFAEVYLRARKAA